MLNKTENSPANYAMLGMIRCVAGFPVEHPLATLKLRMQGNPSTPQIAIILKNLSVSKLYAGSVASLSQRVVRESIRWPAISLFNRLWANVFPSEASNFQVVKNASLGASIAGLESLVILPIERLIVAQVNEGGYRAFYQKQFRVNGVRSLYSGLSVNVINNFLVWTTFTTMNYWMKFQVSRTEFSKKQPAFSNFVANAGIAASLVLVALPPNFVKTRIQMEPELQQIKIKKIIPLLVKRYGVKGFYAGSPYTFAHSLIHTYLAGRILDKITNHSSN